MQVVDCSSEDPVFGGGEEGEGWQECCWCGGGGHDGSGVGGWLLDVSVGGYGCVSVML